MSDREQVLAAWRELGRPGARLVQQYLRRQGRTLKEGQIADILKEETSHQVFGKVWPSPGYIVAPGKNSTWQMDILDNTSRDPAINQNYRYAVIVVDVWSRMVVAYPIRVKTPQQSVEALLAARRVLGGLPKVVETDAGAEFKGVFEIFCRSRDILLVTRDVDHRNGLAVVDSAIARLRRAIGKAQIENDESGWVQPLQNAATALNKRPQRQLFGNSPNEVVRDNEAQWVQDIHAGRQMMYQTGMIRRMQDKLRSAGKFRPAIGYDKRTKPSSNPAYSAKIHTVRAVDGTMVKDEQGDLYRIWLVQPVVGGRNIQYFPKGARPGNEDKNEQLRSKLSLFAEALEAHLKRFRYAIGTKEAGAWLNGLPGWRQDGVPVMQLLELFPEQFEVLGRPGDTRVRAR
ncbi:MAG: hypothetical protein B7Z80_19535 [Rhodospirillales bacterium 20-64-7]|nr:MAG: hypothetical protein B7Z80_19535 [Rhodospirillales bacterium 20-64-7]